MTGEILGKNSIIRLMAVTFFSLVGYFSFGQVIDSTQRPLRPANVKAPAIAKPPQTNLPLDNRLRMTWMDSTRGLVRVDSSKKSLWAKADSAKRGKKLANNNIFQFFRNAISQGGAHIDSADLLGIRGKRIDSSILASTLNNKAEAPFKRYEGRIIRHIIVRGYGFEQTFTDTSKRLQYAGTKLLNSLHHKTRDWVIRNSLFIKENTALSAYKLADNERLIRSLNYIQDARILVDSIPGRKDSVDLIVVTKDLFSLGGSISAFNFSPVGFRGTISDANAFGLGQRMEVGTFIEQNRDPNFGYSLLYTKSNMGKTFVNLTATYTQTNSDLKDGTPDEQAWYVKLERPLYAPYAHLAGGLTVGEFESFNRYKRPDTSFFKYHYRTHDIWLGWNIGPEKFLSNTSVRDRRFIAVRYFNNHFVQSPYQLGEKYNFRFNDREALLGSFTFFRQDFYKTNYIYGFGVTEDVPYGYNLTFTGGWYKQSALERFYAGVEGNGYVATDKGDFIQYFLRSGGFLKNGTLQDGSFLIGTSIYSRLFLFNRVKIRQYFNFSYTKQFDRVAIDPLTINNVFGLRYFSGDSTFGSNRITIHSETSFFLNYKFLGFKFAPFAFGDLSLLTPEHEGFTRASLYHGIGAGIRTRNENLIFKTIELRLAYFPRQTAQNSSFKIIFNTGIQFRYNNTYVLPPDVVYLNNDGLNSIY